MACDVNYAGAEDTTRHIHRTFNAKAGPAGTAYRLMAQKKTPQGNAAVTAEDF
jgi:hypothetical protein